MVERRRAAMSEENPCCQIAVLSGFLRTAGSVIIYRGSVGFSAVGEIVVLEYFAALIEKIYGDKPKITPDRNKPSRGEMQLVSPFSAKILQDAEIAEIDASGINLEFSPRYAVENECCKRAFVAGAFLGSGSITLPHVDKKVAEGGGTGYHLEISFTQQYTAEYFSRLLSSLGFPAKLIGRKNGFVVYMKNAQEINDFVTFLGAVKATLEMTEIILIKGVINNTNRHLNCEMSNLTKQVNAAIKDKEAITFIIENRGAGYLPAELKKVAEARLEASEETSLSELADTLKITKSCLSHRLRRLNEIAAEIRDK